jgi:hypothetical protein
MAVFQPLYYAAGKYSADTDRRFAASLFDTSQSTGLPASGVIPSYFSTNSLKASTSGSNLVVTVQPGMCVIADVVSPTAADPGLYIAGLSSAETVTLAANAGGAPVTDVIYAVVDETGYVVTNKVLTGDVATLTTSTDHGFSTNETVVVSGVDSVFDGTYTISAVQRSGPYTFSYTKTNDAISSTAVTATASGYSGSAWFSIDIIGKSITDNIATIATDGTHSFSAGKVATIFGVDGTFDGTFTVINAPTTTSFTYSIPRKVNNVSSAASPTAVASSALARARVPFAIKAERSTSIGVTYPSLATKTKLEIARVSVPGTPATAIPIGSTTDTRRYTNLLGGIAYYNSNSTQLDYHPTGSAGRLKYDVYTGILSVYDHLDSEWRDLYNTTSNNHDTQLADASTTALHHTIGTTATQAAAGNHVHSGLYVERVDGTVSAASPTGGVVRNIYLSTSPTASGGNDGDVWLTYTP